MTINIYLTFDGNCEQVFNFYKSAFDRECRIMHRFKDMPPQEGMQEIPDDLKDKIMHVSLPISDETVLMASDRAPWGPNLHQGNNFSISVNTGDFNEAKRIFEALSIDGKVTMPMEKTFWNAHFGMLTDQFGINWMVNCEINEKA